MFSSLTTMSYSEAIRGYFKGLRNGKKWNQARAAQAAGVPLRTYQAWETGETKDIKGPRVAEVITALGGAVEHLAILKTLKSEQEGRDLALEWQRTPEGQKQAKRLEIKAARIIALSDEDPESFERMIEQVRQDQKADPSTIEAVMIFLAGRRSRG